MKIRDRYIVASNGAKLDTETALHAKLDADEAFLRKLCDVSPYGTN